MESAFFADTAVKRADLVAVNDAMRRWHAQIGSEQSFLLPLEEFTNEGATELVNWLGFPGCTVHQTPHANDPDSSFVGSDYHDDYAGVKLTCKP